VACVQSARTPDAGRLVPDAAGPKTTDRAALADAANGAARFPAEDLDGDGQPDEVVFQHTGGADCCFRVGVRLSSTSETVMLPFDLDGAPGTVPPKAFSVDRQLMGPHRLILEIENHGGQQRSLARWTEKYGVTSHKIAVTFWRGQPRVRDADPRAWRTAYDWDGDGKNDDVDDRFSGGAHCCYTLGVRLSSRRKMVWLPFWMDGGIDYGYPMDFPDLPEQFSIGRTPKGLPEMRIEILTSSGLRAPLPQSWRDRYGIRSHHIGVSFPRGDVRLRDVLRR
jgi:hypothetical protein